MNIVGYVKNSIQNIIIKNGTYLLVKVIEFYFNNI